MFGHPFLTRVMTIFIKTYIFVKAKSDSLRSRKKSNLFPLRLLECDGHLSFDHEKWVPEAEREFESTRWGCTDSYDAEIFSSYGGSNDSNILLGEDDIDIAVNRAKRPLELDAKGVCVQAFRECPSVQRAFKKPLEDMLNKDGAWTERIEEGFIKGKIKDTRHLKDCRGVFPQSTVLQILTLLVSIAVQPLCSLYDLGDACWRNVFLDMAEVDKFTTLFLVLHKCWKKDATDTIVALWRCKTYSHITIPSCLESHFGGCATEVSVRIGRVPWSDFIDAPNLSCELEPLEQEPCTNLEELPRATRRLRYLAKS